MEQQDQLVLNLPLVTLAIIGQSSLRNYIVHVVDGIYSSIRKSRVQANNFEIKRTTIQMVNLKTNLEVTLLMI